MREAVDLAWDPLLQPSVPPDTPLASAPAPAPDPAPAPSSGLASFSFSDPDPPPASLVPDLQQPSALAPTPRLRVDPPRMASRPASTLFGDGDDYGDTAGYGYAYGGPAGEEDGTTPPGSAADVSSASAVDTDTEGLENLIRLHTLSHDELSADLLNMGPIPALVRHLSSSLARMSARATTAETRAAQLGSRLDQVQRGKASEAHVARAREQALSTVARTYGAGEGELERALARVSQQRSAAQRRRGQQLRLGKSLQEAMGASLSESPTLMPLEGMHCPSGPTSNGALSTSAHSVALTSHMSRASSRVSDISSEANEEDGEHRPVVLDATTGKPVPVPSAQEAREELEAAAEEEFRADPDPNPNPGPDPDPGPNPLQGPGSVPGPDTASYLPPSSPDSRDKPPSMTSQSSFRANAGRSGSIRSCSGSVVSHTQASSNSSVTTASRKAKDREREGAASGTSLASWIFGSGKARTQQSVSDVAGDGDSSKKDTPPTEQAQPQSLSGSEHSNTHDPNPDPHPSSSTLPATTPTSLSQPQNPAELGSSTTRKAKKAGALSLFGSLPWRRSIDLVAGTSPSDSGSSKSVKASLPPISDNPSANSVAAAEFQHDSPGSDQDAAPTQSEPPNAPTAPSISNTPGSTTMADTLPLSIPHSVAGSAPSTREVPIEESSAYLTPRPKRNHQTDPIGEAHPARTPRLGPSLAHPSQLYRSVSHSNSAYPNVAASVTSCATPLRTLELKPMVPKEARPPTLSSGPSTTVKKYDFTPGQDPFEVYGGYSSTHATQSGSEDRSEKVLTDRYGFMYAGSPADIRLLRQAKAAKAPAPACLAGTRAEALLNEEEDLPPGWNDSSSLTSFRPDSPGSSTPTTSCTRSPSSVASGSNSPNGNGTVSSILVQPKSRAMAKSSGIVVSTRSEASPDSPGPDSDRLENHNDALPATATVKTLLKSLDELYDSQQLKQQAKWDVFLAEQREKREMARKQKKTLTPDMGHGPAVRGSMTSRGSELSTTLVSKLANPSSGSTPAPEEEDENVALLHDNLALVGIAAMGTTARGKDDWNAFVTLCLSGIPLRYRGQVWAECAGANDLADPGRYDELLRQSGVCDDDGLDLDAGSTARRAVTSASQGSAAVLAQIDLDVHRTLPTNVFFGGDGPGVPKLRRVLAAFSWYDLDIGYCQGTRASLRHARTPAHSDHLALTCEYVQ